MAKINNRGIYKNIDSPSLSDFLLGTKEEDGSTKSFPLQSVIQLINGVKGKNNIQYKFSDGSDPDIDYTTSGTFFTNNNSTSLPNFTELIFNKENLQPFDLSLLFNKIGVSEDIILKLEHPENPNIFFNLKVISFVDNTEYFVFGVQPFKDFYLGSLENEKIYSLYFDLQVISEEEKADKIIKSGNINISGLTISILENDFQWRINQQDFLNTPELINFPIPPAADGFYRSDILVGTSNNDYQLIQGTPDSSASVEPQAPINTIRIAGISLFGAIVGQPTPTPITNFIEKSERANVVLTGSGVINQLNLVDEKATIVFNNAITRLNTISYASVPYNGKTIRLFNAQATPVTIGHSVSGYGVDFVFSDAQDYILLPNQTIEFSFDITYAPYAHHMLIGSKTDISGKEDKSQKGAPNGYAPLDEFTKLAAQYLNIVNDLVTGGATSLLSAEQGKVLQTQVNAINTLLTSDNVNLDTVQELVDAIETVQLSLSTILVNDLTTGGSTKALTAEMGKLLQTNKVDKVAGERLINAAEITKLAGIEDWVNNQIAEVVVDSTNLGALTPFTEIPATINVHGFAVEVGTYTNCGGVVVPANTYAFISRVGGVWKITKTGLDISSKVNVSDIVDNLTTDDSGKPVSSKQAKILDNTSLDVLSTNIYNARKSITGYVDYGSGDVVPIAGYKASDFLPIKPNTTYTQNQKYQIAFFNSSKVYISGDVGTSKTYTTPANAAFFRIGVQDTWVDNFWIVEGVKQYAFGRSVVGFLERGVLSKNVAGIDLPGLEENLRYKNIFDKTKIISEYYVAGVDGGLNYAGGDYYASYPIRIIGGATYEFGDVNAQQYALYDKNGIYLTGYSSNVGTESKTFTAPHEAVFLRFTGIESVVGQQYVIQIANGNMFDKYTQIANTYIGYGDGIATPAAGYLATEFLPVKPNTVYEFGSTGSQQLAFYDKNKNYISGYAGGVSGAHLKRITTPKGVELIRFTTQMGLASSQYFIEIPKKEDVRTIKLTAVQNTNNWNSIRDLAMTCKQDASRFKKYEILVPNGTWNECDWGNFGEFVSIKGQDRYLTIINCDGTDTNVNHVVPGDYIGSGAYAGLQFAAVPKNWRHLVFMVSDLNVSNMTFRAKSCKYVAHIDSDTKFKNVLFENISFDEDDCNTPIGMGVWGGNNILFKYCSIKRALPGGLGVLFHNWNDQPEDSKTEFYGCKFKNCGYVDVQELGSQKNDYLILNSCKTDFVDISRYIVSSSSAYVPKTSTPYSIHVVVINTPGFIIDSYADRPLYLERNEF